MLIKCPKCGYKNADDVVICNLCSNKIDVAAVKAAGGGSPGARRPMGDEFMFEPRMLGAGAVNRRAPGGAGASAPPPPAERHYLVPPTGEPARIEAGTVYLMGREETAQIRITAPRVSRKHAEIKFDHGKPSVHDLGSQNGTLLNGTKLASQAHSELKDRDVIDIGGVTVTYRLLKPGDSEAKLKEGNTESTMIAEEPGAKGDLTGNVALMPIGDVLRRLESLAATGLLVVEAGGAKGAIRIEHGRAVAGSYAGLEAESAIAAVRSLAQGQFRFEMQDPDAPLSEVVVPEAPRQPPQATPKPAPRPAPPRPNPPRPGPPAPPAPPR
jgi:pSer/pThr/pTyr-binding forkhead associated (FHA) protein